MADIVVLDASQMATVLKRYVDILTKKEAHLLEQEGFFNREEHFELFLQEVRTEFDSHPKIRACFAHKAGALSCIQFLLGRGEHARDAVNESRRYELSFMSTVLLRTSSVAGVLTTEPALLAELLAFAEQPAPLDEAIMHYWCKVFRHLVGLHVCDRRLVRALSALVAHVADDSVQAVLSEYLGTLVGGVSLLRCLEEGGCNPLAPLVDALFQSARGARNACAVLCAACVAVSEAQDKRAHALVWRALAPALPRFLHAVFGGAIDAARAHYGPCIEHCLSFLVELLMLHTRVGADASTAEGGAVRLLLPHFGALHRMLRSEQTFVQLKAAEVLTVALVLVEEADDDALAVAIVRARLLPLSISLFFAPDVNGGGRQDFLRHVLLRVFCEALACDNAPVHAELLRPGRGALAATIVRSARRPLAYGSVTHTQMALRLVNDACARVPLVRKLCAETAGWRSVVHAVVGAAGAALKSPEPSEPLDDAENEDPHRSPPLLASPRAGASGARKPSARGARGGGALADDIEDELASEFGGQRLDDALEHQPLAAWPPHERARAPVPLGERAQRDGGSLYASNFAAGAGAVEGEITSVHPGSSSPCADGADAAERDASDVLVVEGETFKSSAVPYYDTPKPKLVKRIFYSRSAKAASPFFKSPSAGVGSALAQHDAEQRAADADGDADGRVLSF
ncbi:hypothetical protein KFE25_012202 [Diacronema lutheri]|uniref:Uncharacterized protein n=1 Tax=Diacronema lutheri TaxID=2081491 RepID=A0A8J6C580_DIALT|nr:hypothetical protein KFE25_012202 [Diacronema lutheri]